MKTIDINKVIGLYPLFYTAVVVIHEIDYAKDKVLISINGDDPKWCDISEQYIKTTKKWELGFYLGSTFIAFSNVIKLREDHEENSRTENPAD